MQFMWCNFRICCHGERRRNSFTSTRRGLNNSIPFDIFNMYLQGWCGGQYQGEGEDNEDCNDPHVYQSNSELFLESSSLLKISRSNFHNCGQWLRNNNHYQMVTSARSDDSIWLFRWININCLVYGLRNRNRAWVDTLLWSSSRNTLPSIIFQVGRIIEPRRSPHHGNATVLLHIPINVAPMKQLPPNRTTAKQISIPFAMDLAVLCWWRPTN